MDGLGERINTSDLSVHHIVPISEAWEKRFDESNLATLCDHHHEQAEAGLIDRKKLQGAVERSMTGQLYIPPLLVSD
jgi:5-methylcytosine-specific restriction endonuclease McrA